MIALAPIGLQNIARGHGVGIALIGMLIVFGGLLLVTMYLTLLPRFFVWAGWAQQRASARIEAVEAVLLDRAEAAGLDPDLLAAIAYVLQAEAEREISLDHQRITLRDGNEQRVWTAMGKMRTLATRI